jgi:hypothetical protein
VVVKRGCALVEATGVPRVAISELLIVQVVARLVAEDAEIGSKGSNLLTDGRSHLNPDPHSFGIAVSEQLCNPAAFANVEVARREDADCQSFDPIRVGSKG